MKKFLLFIVLLVIATGAALLYLREQEFVVHLSEADLQEEIDEAFPVEKQFVVLLTLRLSEPRVMLVEGSDRVHYQMRASVTVPGREFSGTGRISGELRYDAETRDLYIDQSVVEEIDIEAVPSQYQVPLREAADLLARQHLDRHPVYTLDEEFFQRFPGPVVMRDVRVVDGELRIAFGLADRFWTKLGIGESGN
ncbi:MAG: DUF1439 domain-containing protein [Opitutales bacterium]